MASLIERLLKGDDKAVSEFYYLYSKQLLFYLQKRVPKEIAEEMVSDVFLNAVDSLHTLELDTNLRAWLYKIAHNKTVDYYRKKKLKTVLLSQIPFLEIVAAEIHEPEFQIEKNHIRDRIEKTLRNLSEKYRKILMLAYEEQMPIVDIAPIFNLSPKATESLLYRARQSFITEYGRT